MALKRERRGEERQALTLTGILTIGPSGARLNGQILMFRMRGPRAAAIYLKRRGFKDGDRIRVTGSYRTLRDKAVFSMTSVEEIIDQSFQRPGKIHSQGQREKIGGSFIERHRGRFKKTAKKSAKKKISKKDGAAHRRYPVRGVIGAGGPEPPRRKATKKKSSKKFLSDDFPVGHDYPIGHDAGDAPPPPPDDGVRGAFQEPPRKGQKAKPPTPLEVLPGAPSVSDDENIERAIMAEFPPGKTKGGPPPKLKQPPKASGSAPQPELKLIEATPQLDIVKTLAPGVSYRMAVFVDQGAEAPGAEVERVKLKIPHKLKKVTLDVWFDCSSHFSIQDVADPSRITIYVSTGISDKLEFTLNVVNAGGNDGRPMYVSAFFRYKDRPCGKIKRYLEMKNGELSWKKSDPPPSTKGEVILPNVGAPPSITVEAAGAPADIRVEVLNTEANDGRQYTLECITPQGKWKGPWNLPQVTRDFVNARMDGFMKAKGTGRIGALKGAGMEFWKAIRKEARDLLWNALQKGVKTMSVISEEPYIPWELMAPHLVPAKARQPLGVELQLGRWVTADYKAAPQKVPMKDGYIIAPKSSGLTNAPQEVKFLQGLVPLGFNAHDPIDPADVEGINKALGEGSRNVVHFICHGKNAALQTLVVEKLESLSCSAVLGLEGFQKAFEGGPLAFLNACEAGAITPSLDGIGGFANSFIQLGASAVIAPLWSVQDSVAYDVTQIFYGEALKGSPFAEIMKTIRAKAYTTAIDSYAAYCFYGDPLALMA